jgi:hypothetical protein
VRAEALGDQRHPDHQQEAQRQHHDGGVGVDEVRERGGGEQHHGHGDQDRDHHDRDVLRHADRGDDAVDREHQVQHQDLADRGRHAHAGRLAGLEHVRAGLGVDVVVDLLGGLPDQEQAAGDQDQVAPGEAVAERGEDRLGEPHDDRDGPQQRQAHDQGGADAEAAGPGPLVLGQLVGEDRDEDQVVDAEHDLHHDQRDEGHPGGRVGEQGEQVVHGSSGVPLDIARRGTA